MTKLLYTIAALTISAGFTFAQAPEPPKNPSETPGIPEISHEFDRGMPADVKAEMEAARAAAEVKRQELQGLTSEEIKAKVQTLRAEADAKRDAALQNLDEDRRAKVEAILEKVKAQDQGRDGELRERLEAVEALKAAREKAAEQSHEGLDKSLDGVQKN